jgi:ATP-dependent helicase/nuclease subunit A
MRKWTTEQDHAITTTGHSLLVSAAAGSGKTSVLSERCAQLVCEARHDCEIDDLLVVTFTEAAAAEMRGRIEQTLRERLVNADSERLRKQLALVEGAEISTHNGFGA